MSKVVSREMLLKSFESLQNQFNSALTEAKTQDEKFLKLRQRFQSNMTQRLNVARQKLPKNNPMLEQIEGFISLLESTNAEWDKKISARDRGVQFRSGFNDSLLVFVYGKVKSGKSSLGNYIAWGNTDPNDDIKMSTGNELEPEYFSHDKTDVAGGDSYKEAEKTKEFRVGAIETTSSIQGFKLAGLTWVDSPGLHSVNEVNGELAKDYVQHADLILYTMKSDAPGRMSDFREIRLLFKKSKETLLIITGSDDTGEEDWDYEKQLPITPVVMKDKERCLAQGKDVLNRLKDFFRISDDKFNNLKNLKDDKLDELKNISDMFDLPDVNLPNNIKIISVSARYAQLNENNAEAFKESGMEQLCRTLYEISQKDGVKLKQKVPMNNFKNFLESCVEDLKPYHDLVRDFDAPIIELQRSIPQQARNVTRDTQDKLRTIVDNQFDILSRKRDDKSVMQQALVAMKNKLADEHGKLIEEGLATIFESIVAGFRDAVITTYQSSDFVKLPDFKVETIEDRIPSSVNSGTRKRNSGLGSILGAGIGFLVGGPLGAAIGSGLGGGVGYASGDDSNVNYRTIELNVGDNLQDIKQSVIAQLTQSVEKSIQEQSAKMLKFLLDDAQNLVRDLEHEISLTEKDLQQLLVDTKHKLA